MLYSLDIFLIAQHGCQYLGYGRRTVCFEISIINLNVVLVATATAIMQATFVITLNVRTAI